MKNVLLLTLGLMAAADGAPQAGASTTTDKPKDDKPAAPKKVKVKVLVGAVAEDGEHHLKDAIFETTAKRAAELGSSVELVK